MNRNTKVINEILNTNHKEFTIFNIIFRKEDVYRKYDGFPDVWKSLTNGLNIFAQTHNRIWFKKLEVSGLYRYEMDDQFIHVNVYMDKDIPVDEFIDRITHLCPVYKIQVTKNDPTSKKNIINVEVGNCIFGKYSKHYV